MVNEGRPRAGTRSRKGPNDGPRQLVIRNRQSVRGVNLPLLRQIGRHLIGQYLRYDFFELCLHLVEDAEMRRVHEQFLQDKNATDVITFDHSSLFKLPPAPRSTQQRPSLHGELYICLSEALSQARKFRTTWQMELSRYLVHGLLHLCGYNDQQPQARRRMKTVENRLVRRLANEFPLSSLLVTRRRPPRRRPASKPPSRRE